MKDSQLRKYIPYKRFLKSFQTRKILAVMAEYNEYNNMHSPLPNVTFTSAW